MNIKFSPIKRYTFIRLFGGLGNQLFIYAFGLAKSKNLKSTLIIDDISGFSKRDIYNAVFCLNEYNLNKKLLSQSLLRYFIGNRYFWFLARIFKSGYFEKNFENFDRSAKDSTLNFYQGYWQHYSYFNEYRDVLKKSLVLKDTSNVQIKRYSNRIKESDNSVALCLRFYDTFPGDNEIHNAQNSSYYSKAIELLESSHENLTFFIFSMNIKKAQKMLSDHLDKDIVFIEPLKGLEFAHIDLHLMTLCNHFIISNSTMYWWAAYLGEKPKSCIICPKDGFVNNDMLLPNWQKA